MTFQAQCGKLFVSFCCSSENRLRRSQSWMKHRVSPLHIQTDYDTYADCGAKHFQRNKLLLELECVLNHPCLSNHISGAELTVV